MLAVPDEVMAKVGAVLYGTDDELDVKRVLAHCRERLADFKVPQYVTVADQPLPRDPSGKLLEAELRGSVRWDEPLR